MNTICVAFMCAFVCICLNETRDNYNDAVRRNIVPLVVEVFDYTSFNCPMMPEDPLTIPEIQRGCAKVCLLAEKAMGERSAIRAENRRIFWSSGLIARGFDYSRQFIFGKPRFRQKGCSALLWGASRTNKGVSDMLGILLNICFGYIFVAIVFVITRLIWSM